MFDELEELVVETTNNVMANRSVTYNLKPENTSQVIESLFENKWIEVNGVTSTHPTLRLDASLIPRKPSKQDTLTIDTVTYRILEIRNEGIGAFTLILQK